VWSQHTSPGRIARIRAEGNGVEIVRFPMYRSKNLNRQPVVVPDTLDGDPRLLIAAFEQWQQKLVDSWVPTLDELETAVPGFRYYELPVVGERGRMFRVMLDNGMRAGIRNSTTRGRTITVYQSVAEFCAALDIPSTETIHMFLVDPEGGVTWSGSGGYESETAAELRRLISPPAGDT
jgi:hypothetical protein